MSADTLEQVKNLIDKLSPVEQECLLEYLKPKGTTESQPPQSSGVESYKEKSLEKFRRIRDQLVARKARKVEATTAQGISLEEAFRMSDELAANEDSNHETMTQEFLRTRR